MKRAALRCAVLAVAMLSGCGAEKSKPPAGAGSAIAAAPSMAPGSPGPTVVPPEAASPTTPAGSQGSSTAPASAAADDDAPGACGSVVCAPGQFCEDLYKGHALDVRGRPLDRKKCVPLPDSCKATPTCACVTKQIASTHCTDDGGHVYVNDYPARR